MRIFYFSNHIGDTDFNLLVKNVSQKPNPAGQNFHGKVIESLALTNDVICFSLVPSAEEGFQRKTGIKGNGIPHYYFYPKKRSLLPSAITIPGKVLKTAKQKYPPKDNVPTIVVFDTLNIAMARAAQMVSKEYKAKTIAICTDDPFNITDAGEHYLGLVLHFAKNCDGYFCLTNELNRLFNPYGKPSCIHLGIAENSGVLQRNLEKPYIYYGGALFYKDGTDALLQAFVEARPNCLLVLSGHGPSKAKAIEYAKDNPNIIFLGQISKEENYAYQKGAALCINPRLYRDYLDKTSVPSKVVEYLVNAKAIASTLSTPLKEKFESDIEWIPSDPEIAPAQLKEFLLSHMDENGNLINLKECKVKDYVLEHYGKEGTNKVFESLIQEIVSGSN